MLVYNYDRISGEYTGSTSADESPLEENTFLIPACATLIQPPEVGVNETAVFSGEWVVTPDYCEEQFYNTNGDSVSLALGETPEGLTKIPRPDLFYTLIDGVWVDDQEARIEAWRATATCGPLEMRRALRSTGDLPAVKAYISTADEETQEAWQYATVFKRLDPMVLGVQALLGKTDIEADDLFKLAVTLG